MTLLNNADDTIKVTMKPNSEMTIPSRGPFSGFPRLRIIKILSGGTWTSTEYWPTNDSRPSTRHPKTIRLINLNWVGVEAKVEYDDTSKLIKVLDCNVESITIEIK